MQPGVVGGIWSVRFTGGVESREERLQLIFFCRARDKPEGLGLLGGTESGEVLWAGYLVFWQVWPVFDSYFLLYIFDIPFCSLLPSGHFLLAYLQEAYLVSKPFNGIPKLVIFSSVFSSQFVQNINSKALLKFYLFIFCLCFQLVISLKETLF